MGSPRHHRAGCRAHTAAYMCYMYICIWGLHAAIMRGVEPTLQQGGCLCMAVLANDTAHAAGCPAPAVYSGRAGGASLQHVVYMYIYGSPACSVLGSSRGCIAPTSSGVIISVGYPAAPPINVCTCNTYIYTNKSGTLRNGHPYMYMYAIHNV